jgi:hypothetical protein
MSANPAMNLMKHLEAAIVSAHARNGRCYVAAPSANHSKIVG